MLNVLMTPKKLKSKNNKKTQEHFCGGSDEYVCHFGYGNGIMVHTQVQTHPCVYIRHVQVCHSYILSILQ